MIVLRFCKYFSVINRLRAKDRIAVGNRFPRIFSHQYQDKLGTATYQEVKNKLTPHQQYLITTKAMERPFTGNLHAQVSTGFYHCAVCDTRLFTFNQKYISNTGFATFWKAIDKRVSCSDEEVEFDDVNQVRIRYRPRPTSYQRCSCSQCHSHLGVVYPDGPGPTFLRYSINSALLKFYDMPDFENPKEARLKKKQEKPTTRIDYLMSKPIAEKPNKARHRARLQRVIKNHKKAKSKEKKKQRNQLEKKEQKLAKEGKKNQSESNDNVYDRKDQ